MSLCFVVEIVFGLHDALKACSSIQSLQQSFQDFRISHQHLTTLLKNHERNLKTAHDSATERYGLTRDLKNLEEDINALWDWYCCRGIVIPDKILLDWGFEEGAISNGMAYQLSLERQNLAMTVLHGLSMKSPENIPHQDFDIYLEEYGHLFTISNPHPCREASEQNTLEWHSSEASEVLKQQHYWHAPTESRVFENILLMQEKRQRAARALRFFQRIKHFSPKSPALTSTVESLLHLVKAALSTKASKKLLCFSPLMFAPSVNGFAFPPQGDATGFQGGVPGFQGVYPPGLPGGVLDSDTWARVIGALQQPWNKYFSNRHAPEPGLAAHPSTILLACFVCTGSLALATHIRRKDRYQSYVLTFSALGATMIGTVRTKRRTSHSVGSMSRTVTVIDIRDGGRIQNVEDSPCQPPDLQLMRLRDLVVDPDFWKFC
ncbi:MAG: hypothetical protein Q9223_002344 [Gallowayella weberi]